MTAVAAVAAAAVVHGEERVMLSEESLQKDLHAAMRARDQRRVDVLRGLITVAKNLKVERRGAALAETDLVAIVRKEVNKRTEIIGFAEKGGRAEAAAAAAAERALLQAYLPAQIEGEELRQVIRALAEELGNTQIGPLMGELKKRHEGRFDGKEASALIRELNT